MIFAEWMRRQWHALHRQRPMRSAQRRSASPLSNCGRPPLSGAMCCQFFAIVPEYVATAAMEKSAPSYDNIKPALLPRLIKASAVLRLTPTLRSQIHA
jgi:hypothetical protein